MRRMIAVKGGIAAAAQRRNVRRVNLLQIHVEKVDAGEPRMTFDLKERQVKEKKSGTRVKRTRPNTRHKMRLICVLFTFENNTGPTDRRTDRRTDGNNLL